MTRTGAKRLAAAAALLLAGGVGGWFLALRYGTEAPPPVAPDGTVEGVCTLKVHRGPAGLGVESHPLPGARVEVFKGGGAERYTEVIADRAGRFAVRLPAGRYELRLTAPVASESPVAVDVEPGQTRTVELTIDEFQT